MFACLIKTYLPKWGNVPSQWDLVIGTASRVMLTSLFPKFLQLKRTTKTTWFVKVEYSRNVDIITVRAVREYVLENIQLWNQVNVPVSLPPRSFHFRGTIRRIPKRNSPTRRMAGWPSVWSLRMRTRGSTRKDWTTRTGPLRELRKIWRNQSWRYTYHDISIIVIIIIYVYIYIRYPWTRTCERYPGVDKSYLIMRRTPPGQVPAHQVSVWKQELCLIFFDLLKNIDFYKNLVRHGPLVHHDDLGIH